jgi:1-acyl-sn-glycerol-3-phosphate acyltransferase
MTVENRENPAMPGILRHTPGQVLCYHIVGLLLRMFFRVYGRLQVIGLRENIPQTGPILLCANHASNLDPPLGWAAFYGYRRLRGVAKVELWQNRAAAYVMNAHDSISIKRGGVDRSMFRSVLDGMAHGDAIGLFPEGTRTYDGKLNPGLPGIGMLVQKSGIPVAPVAVLGTFEMLPRGQKKLKRSRIRIVFGKPISFEPGTSREQIAEQIMAAIAGLMTENGVPTTTPGPERAALLAERAAGPGSA